MQDRIAWGMLPPMLTAEHISCILYLFGLRESMVLRREGFTKVRTTSIGIAVCRDTFGAWLFKQNF